MSEEFANQCPILYTPLLLSEAMLIWVTPESSPRRHKLYYVGNQDLLNQLHCCPMTRTKGSYQAVALAKLSQEQLQRLMDNNTPNHLIEDHETLVQLLKSEQMASFPWTTQVFQAEAQHHLAEAWVVESPPEPSPEQLLLDTLGDLANAFFRRHGGRMPLPEYEQLLEPFKEDLLQAITSLDKLTDTYLTRLPRPCRYILLRWLEPTLTNWSFDGHSLSYLLGFLEPDAQRTVLNAIAQQLPSLFWQNLGKIELFSSLTGKPFYFVPSRSRDIKKGLNHCQRHLISGLAAEAKELFLISALEAYQHQCSYNDARLFGRSTREKKQQASQLTQQITQHETINGNYGGIRSTVRQIARMARH